MDIFADDVVAAAILDRLLHHCYPFFIQGKSIIHQNDGEKEGAIKNMKRIKSL
ncbi:MAG: ATP-binding protein [Pseudomonadota bacterium]|nr:ATP-binding protein [Pseudomonadota bacterium]